MQNQDELLSLMGLPFGTGQGAGTMDIVNLVRRGLPTGFVQALLDSGRLTASELDQIVLHARRWHIGVSWGHSQLSSQTG